MRTALLWGYTHHVRAISDFFNRHASGWRLISRGGDLAERNRVLGVLPFVDAVVQFGGPAPDALVAACARRLRKPIAVIWAGSDILRIRETPDEIARIKARGHRHAACSAALAKELCELGIPAKELRLVVGTSPSVIPPLPPQFSVLGYGPRGKEWLYGTDILLAVAERMPQVRFDILGDVAEDNDLPNVVFHGWLDDVTPALDAATVVLRPTRHDGMPLMVVDALARGRYVIWSKPLAGAIRAESSDDIVMHLTELEEMHRNGLLALNREGLRSVNDSFAPEAVTTGIEDFLDDLVAPRLHSSERKRGVVSGEPDVVAAFLEQARREAPEWDIHSVLGKSKSERLDDVLSMAASQKWFCLSGTRLDPLVAAVARLLRKSPTTVNFQPGTVLNGTLRPAARRRSKMKLSASEWQAFDACHPAPTFFARPAWGLSLQRTFHRFSAEPTYFNLPEGEAVFPLMRSGRRFAAFEAMPLGTYALPLQPDGLPADAKLAAAIVREIIDEKADDFSCAFWPLARYGTIDVGEWKMHHASIIDLRDGVESALARFKGVARRMAGQAVRKGVTCSRESNAVDVYYELLEESARRWGLAAPHIPRDLFAAVVELGGDDVEIWIARYKGEAIAGGVLLYGSTEAFFWSAALRAEHADLRPSNLLNVEMIKAAVERGVQWYNLGASEGLSGVARFKESLGAQLFEYPSLSWQSPTYQKYSRLRSLLKRKTSPVSAAAD